MSMETTDLVSVEDATAWLAEVLSKRIKWSLETGPYLTDDVGDERAVTVVQASCDRVGEGLIEMGSSDGSVFLVAVTRKPG